MDVDIYVLIALYLFPGVAATVFYELHNLPKGDRLKRLHQNFPRPIALFASILFWFLFY